MLYLPIEVSFKPSTSQHQSPYHSLRGDRINLAHTPICFHTFAVGTPPCIAAPSPSSHSPSAPPIQRHSLSNTPTSSFRPNKSQNIVRQVILQSSPRRKSQAAKNISNQALSMKIETLTFNFHGEINQPTPHKPQRSPVKERRQQSPGQVHVSRQTYVLVF